jgi:exopolysaccharide biosynthesis polyprenyl glycosylphosphotransferase
MNATATEQAPAPPISEVISPQEIAPEVWLPEDERFPVRSGQGRPRAGYFRQVSYVATDVTLVCLAAILIYGARFGFAHYMGIEIVSAQQFIQQAYAKSYPAFLLLYVALIVMACMSQHLYSAAREIRALGESVKVAKAVGVATALLVLFIFISGNKEISRMVVATAGLVNFGALAGWRYAKRAHDHERAQRGEGVSRALIIGAGRLGQSLAAWLENNRQFGHSVCGFLDAHPTGNARVLGSVRDLRRVVREHFVDQLFITLPADRDLVKDICVEAQRMRLNLYVVPDLYDGLGWHAPLTSIGGFPVIELHREPIPAFGLAVKRLMDVVGALAGLILAAPLLALAAIWIRMDSAGPITYSALRVGKKGKKFLCHKLRTMINDADAYKETLRMTNDRQGPFFKMDNDPRMTRCGRWLRKYSIDELPQLLNVLLGEMSLIGPRPHPLDDYERYNLEHLRRLDVKPGLTGLWQVKARRDPSFETNMKLDLEYIENWDLILDFRILALTIPTVLRGQGQ